MVNKRLFLPSEAQKTQFWNRKHGQKWSKLHQTMCFDTGLQINILYSGLVIILWPFLAFYGKKGYFCHQRHKYAILEQKTWSKMEQTLSDYVFWYCPSDEIVDSGLVILLRPFLAFIATKKGYFCHQRHNILKFWNKKHGQKWSTLYQTMCIDTALQIKIVYSGLVVILRQFLAFHGSEKAIFATRGTKYSILIEKIL